MTLFKESGLDFEVDVSIQLGYNLDHMLLGVHVSTAGAIHEALDRAQALGCNTMQIFSRSPQKWRDRFLESADIQEFRRKQQRFRIKPVFIHLPYLINLASPNPGLYRASIQAYIEDILEASCLEADYIVTHMGSHKGTSEEAGIARLTQALNIVLEETKASPVGILLENTSGSGSGLGYQFAHQKQVILGLKHRQRVGICFDTAHAYSAGYDIATSVGLKQTLLEIDALIGLGWLKLIHLNDAKDILGCHRDRHAHIGKGKIGLAGMRRIINHPKLKDKAFILETPKDKKLADALNLTLVRKLRKK